MTPKEIQQYIQNPEEVDLRYFPYQVAEDFSDLAAILLYDIHGRTKKRKPRKEDGFRWTYDAMRVFTENHSYASEAGIRKAFLALQTAQLLVIEKTGRWNRKKYDKKWWYRITAVGKKNIERWLIRFEPEVAASLDIPKAVIIENFRYHYLKTTAAGHYITINPTKLNLPYSSKTIGRHLDDIVRKGILERAPANKHDYRVPADKWWERNEPVTVAPEKLLPALKNGQIGLLVGHTGTGKTSFSSFFAVQSALAGSKVLFITAEEPEINIINRVYAQEFGVSYSDLHKTSVHAQRVLEEKFNAETNRRAILDTNLRFVDFSGEHPHTHEILDAIEVERAAGFDPDVVIIDQLEFISVELAESDDGVGLPIPSAIATSECLRNTPFKTWVLHQVIGNHSLDFGIEEVNGREDVAKCFDAVIGIGRDNKKLRIFSLSSKLAFEQFLDADYVHMRFVP